MQLFDNQELPKKLVRDGKGGGGLPGSRRAIEEHVRQL